MTTNNHSRIEIDDAAMLRPEPQAGTLNGAAIYQPVYSVRSVDKCRTPLRVGDVVCSVEDEISGTAVAVFDDRCVIYNPVDGYSHGYNVGDCKDFQIIGYAKDATAAPVGASDPRGDTEQLSRLLGVRSSFQDEDFSTSPPPLETMKRALARVIRAKTLIGQIEVLLIAEPEELPGPDGVGWRWADDICIRWIEALLHRADVSLHDLLSSIVARLASVELEREQIDKLLELLVDEPRPGSESPPPAGRTVQPTNRAAGRAGVGAGKTRGRVARVGAA